MWSIFTPDFTISLIHLIVFQNNILDFYHLKLSGVIKSICYILILSFLFFDCIKRIDMANSNLTKKLQRYTLLMATTVTQR